MASKTKPTFDLSNSHPGHLYFKAMENIPNVWSTHPSGHVTIDTSRILELFGTQKPNDRRNALLYAVERVLLELNYKEKREKHDNDMFLLLDALRYTLSETTFREFD